MAPALADASHRVREELVPAAAQLSSRVADAAVQRSAPLRAELSDRAYATLAAARGQVTAAQIEHLKHNGRGHRKLWLIGGAAAAGAALGTAAVLWQRSRDQVWVEDEAVETALRATEAAADQVNAADHGFKSGTGDESEPDSSSTSSDNRSGDR
ncbi:hypothetical protein KGA66_03410 [Actinocrinis puniceicyclus]|uniref:Uncharacterized protein n=1 Tax=Actinocrinis puniceicyclus TaxID=977794 RepID=A0A8J7WH74_9ACTN|nr:hypothetical protein [Actinocrinis puniceicyclus]